MSQWLNKDELVDQLLATKSLAIEFFECKKYLESLRELEKAIQISPSDLELLFYEALCLYHLNNVEQACLIIEQLYEMDTERILPLLPKVCALILIKNNKLNKASSIIDQYLKLQPDDNQLLNMTGYIHEKSGQSSEAEKIYRNILSRDRTNANACNALAYIYRLKKEKWAEATQLIQIALKKEPKNPAYLDTTAMLYVAKHDYQNGLSKLKEARTLAPGNQEILSHLSYVTNLIKSHEAGGSK